MARDSVVDHSDEQLRAGLWQVAAGGDLRYTDPLRAELLQRGLVRQDATSAAVYVTPEGRQFLG